MEAKQQFQIERRENPVAHDVLVLEFRGDLDSGSIQELSKCFEGVVQEKKRYVIVDFSKIVSISSAALGELMGGRKRMIELGGDLVLTGISIDIRTKLNLMGVNKIFRFYNDTRAALNAYKWEFERKAEQVTLAFPPNLRLVPPIRQFISRIARQKGYGNRDSFRIETIVDEVCNNAVEHGLRESRQDIDLSVKIDRDKVEIDVVNVSDPEKVASLKTLLTPLTENAIKQSEDKRGRGLALIKMLSDKMEIHFSEKGTEVHVTKVREE